MSQQISEQIRNQFKQIVDSANQRRLTIREFAIEVWDNTVLEDANYLAFSSFLLEKVTGLQAQPHIEEMVAATLSGDLETTQAAITVISHGLVEYEKTLT
ncbi:hypothetical protein QUB05_26360 [Microcoleus sp. F10-C6]|uniref:hypothetical protein n=1 Tax=unclassified Microcoleus TaxID=2642155 RepID=UPI002FCF29D8